VSSVRVRTPEESQAIGDRCERWIGQLPPSWSRPKALFERLEAAADGHLEPDRYGAGGAVERLEARVAALLGKAAAVVLPSGTMAQQIALRIHADRRRLRTVAFHPLAHLELHEEKGYEWLHGLHARLVGDRGRLPTLADLEEIPEEVAALLLELPQRGLGGLLPDWDELAAQAEWARGRGAALHLDGARLWQCAPWYGRDYAEIAGQFDTVYVSFYKDLGAPGGCGLAGPEDVIAEARVWQIRHGGRVLSLTPYALAAELGLDRFLPQMEAFHRKAVEVAQTLSELDGIEIVPDPPQTAMMHVHLRGDAERLREAALDVAEERAVWVFGRLATTPNPAVHVHELTIGEAALEVPTGEIAELYAEVLERSG
jgi:threonine aldolase